MKFRVGDRVRFLNDVGGGKITRIQGNTAYVLGGDDFEIPIPLTELILVSQESDSTIKRRFETSHDSAELADGFSENDRNQSVTFAHEQENWSSLNFTQDEDGEVDEEGNLIGLFLGFVPVQNDKPTDSDQMLHVINDSPYRVLFALSKWVEDSLEPIYAGFLYPDSKEQIAILQKEEINRGMTINLQCIFFKNRSFVAQQPEFFDFKLNPTKFYRKGSFAENDFFDQEALILSVIDTQKEIMLQSLTEQAIREAKREKEPIKKQKKKINAEIEEIDLHIEELVDNVKLLAPKEILDTQIARFRVALEGAIISKAQKIVFIHGVGNGKLKHELRKILEREFPKLRYQDASFREYGYGATMVFIK